MYAYIYVRAMCRSDLPAILDEFALRLFEEIDYTNEAANSMRFGELYGSIEGLVVPKVPWNLCVYACVCALAMSSGMAHFVEV